MEIQIGRRQTDALSIIDVQIKIAAIVVEIPHLYTVTTGTECPRGRLDDSRVFAIVVYDHLSVDIEHTPVVRRKYETIDTILGYADISVDDQTDIAFHRVGYLHIADSIRATERSLRDAVTTRLGIIIPLGRQTGMQGGRMHSLDILGWHIACPQYLTLLAIGSQRTEGKPGGRSTYNVLSATGEDTSGTLPSVV